MTHLLQLLADQSVLDKFFLPSSSSNLAHDVDWAWNFVLGITGFFFVVVVGAMTFFIFKYRRRGPNDQTSTITHNTPLEIMWTGIPLILVMVIFYIGFRGFIHYDTPQSDCRTVDVHAKTWSFTFYYPNGGVDSNLYLELGKPVKLNITSEDVLHAVYIPAFRTQRNAVPGRTTDIWFIPEEKSPPFINAQEPGGFNLFCTQYCGEQHSLMHAHVYVLDKKEYDEQMVALANPFKDSTTKQWIPYYKVGEKFYTQFGCSQCHAVSEAETKIAHTGPPWWHLWKSTVNFSSPVGCPSLSATDSDEKWEAYIRESVLDPPAKIVSGFQNVMPSQPEFVGSDVNNEKLRAIIEYIKFIGVGYDDATKTNADYLKTHMPNPTANAKLFNADADHPNPPESLAAQKTATTQSAPQP